MFKTRLYIYILSAVALSSCSHDLTKDSALAKLTALEVFQAPYFAPLNVGEVVLTARQHANPAEYIRSEYGPLIEAGLVKVEQTDRNSWRTVLRIELTPKGRSISDPRRATDHKVYVQVCRLVPVSVDTLLVVDPERTIKCAYTFTEQQTTPFGLKMGFSDGRKHRDSLTFLRSGSWNIARPISPTASTEPIQPTIDTTEITTL